METLIGSKYTDRVAELILNANNEIKIAMFVIEWYESNEKRSTNKVIRAIREAIRKGVKVSVILNNATNDKNNGMRNMESAQELAKRGQKVKFYKTGTTLHTKIIIIDNDYVIVGSHNLTNRALNSNQEISVVIDDRYTVRTVKDYFNILFSNS